MPPELATGADRLPLPSTLTAGQQSAMDKVAAGPRGELIAPFVPLLRAPELMTRLQLVGEYLRFGSGLPTHLTELVILIVARRWDQDYEWGHHVPLARAAGLDEHVIAAVRDGGAFTGRRRRPGGVATGQRARIPPRRERFDVRRGTARRRRRRSRRADRHRRLLHDAGHDHERRPHAGARRLRAPASLETSRERAARLPASARRRRRLLGPGARRARITVDDGARSARARLGPAATRRCGDRHLCGGRRRTARRTG